MALLLQKYILRYLVAKVYNVPTYSQMVSEKNIYLYTHSDKERKKIYIEMIMMKQRDNM